VRSILLIGDVSRDRQLEKLKKKPQIAVGSPGRIRELIESRKLKSHFVKTVVIDEADRLFGNSDRQKDIQLIIRSTLKERQLVFVSATESADANDFIRSLAPDVESVRATAPLISSRINHVYLECEE